MTRIPDFRHDIGDRFIDAYGSEVEIVGYNMLDGSYRGKIHHSGRTVNTDTIYEGALDAMTKTFAKTALPKKGGAFYNYRIYYKQNGSKETKSMVMRMSGFKGLMVVLNNLARTDANRRILFVNLQDIHGKFLSTVHITPEEYAEQKFISDFSERLIKANNKKAVTRR